MSASHYLEDLPASSLSSSSSSSSFSLLPAISFEARHLSGARTSPLLNRPPNCLSGHSYTPSACSCAISTLARACPRSISFFGPPCSLSVEALGSSFGEGESEL